TGSSRIIIGPSLVLQPLRRQQHETPLACRLRSTWRLCHDLVSHRRPRGARATPRLTEDLRGRELGVFPRIHREELLEFLVGRACLLPFFVSTQLAGQLPKFSHAP